ncbi:putative protein serine/threonine kinase [Tieghemostelium lacteum]|uniref:ABC1 atypical kinase-like domain-containing protein n=1 Tax=Tieghemostelium lacteum TaxID=361077 RepID=A0A152A650_TIELA|nr:putative protein serine/threonine kinase [Tieghemostelium lacteum]|eukprot:KYR01571.1 putative protein serine/threonine kinase [Tieghemostelium lacteum]
MNTLIRSIIPKGITNIQRINISRNSNHLTSYSLYSYKSNQSLKCNTQLFSTITTLKTYNTSNNNICNIKPLSNTLNRYYSTSQVPPSSINTIQEDTKSKNDQQQQSTNRFINWLTNFIKRNQKKLIRRLLMVMGFYGLSVYIKKYPDHYISGIANIFIRFERAMVTALTVMFNYKLMEWKDKNDPNYNAKLDQLHQESAEKILKLCLANGGLYIKSGQYLASLNHVLPPQYTKTLSVLQDKVLFRPYSEIEKAFIEDFGESPSKVFAEFDKNPIAAASLAQVHKAKTFSGEEVAVKVQYSDVARNFEGDLMTQKIFIKMVEFAFPEFEFSWMADEMKMVLSSELDFVNEAKNGERAKREIQHPMSYIPKVYHEYSSKKVLTTEFIHGCKVNDTKSLHRMGLTEKDVLQNLLEICSEQIFIHGFVHVDPHCGNILVRQHPKYPKRAQVVLIDHGLYREYDNEFRINFCHLYRSLVLCDHKKVQHYSKILGVENYKLFSNIILMRNFENSSVGIGNQVTPEDMEKMMGQFMNDDFMLQVNTLMKSMPRHLFFILRNNNLIRSVNLEVGAPVNRFTIMCRYATQGINSVNNSNKDERYRIIRYLSQVKEKVHLEVLLKGYEYYYWFIGKAIEYLLYYNLIDTQKLIKKAMKNLG